MLVTEQYRKCVNSEKNTNLFLDDMLNFCDFTMLTKAKVRRAISSHMEWGWE